MWGLIGGTGLGELPGFEWQREAGPETPYGPASGPVQIGVLNAVPLAFLARHGGGHRIPPHAINYRANVHALKAAGVTRLVGVAAVGGISEAMAPGEVAVPHDLIDYSWGRAHSYSLGPEDALQHIEFAPPYDGALRLALMEAADACSVPIQRLAVHAVTQGPRLETAAEIRRLARDGCDVVGMTGMPEAALARELALPYACLAVVVNWAAGIGSEAIHAEIEQHLQTGMGKVLTILPALLSRETLPAA